MASGLPGSSLLPSRLPPSSVRWGYSLVLRLRLLLLAGSFGVRFPGLGFCQWSGRPCACCLGALQAVRGFLPKWTVPFLLAFVWRSRFPVLLFILLGPDLSLSRPFFLQPLAPGAIPGWLLCLSWLPSSLGLSLAIFLWHTCWYPSFSVGLSSGSLFPSFLVGYSSSASLGVLPVRSSGLSGVLVSLLGSLLCLPPGYSSSSSPLPVVWLVLLLPSLRPCSRPLFGLLALPPFLLSGLVAVCFP